MSARPDLKAIRFDLEALLAASPRPERAAYTRLLEVVNYTLSLEHQHRAALAACEAMLKQRWDIGMHDTGDGITHRFAGDGEATGCGWCKARAMASAAVSKAVV